MENYVSTFSYVRLTTVEHITVSLEPFLAFLALIFVRRQPYKNFVLHLSKKGI